MSLSFSDDFGVDNEFTLVNARQLTSCITLDGTATVAVISSNDQKSRIMDLATLKFTNIYDFDWPVNVNIILPDIRIKVLGCIPLRPQECHICYVY